jgi:hypothetical protein
MKTQDPFSETIIIEDLKVNYEIVMPLGGWTTTKIFKMLKQMYWEEIMSKACVFE